MFPSISAHPALLSIQHNTGFLFHYVSYIVNKQKAGNDPSSTTAPMYQLLSSVHTAKCKVGHTRKWRPPGCCQNNTVPVTMMQVQTYISAYVILHTLSHKTYNIHTMHDPLITSPGCQWAAQHMYINSCISHLTLYYRVRCIIFECEFRNGNRSHLMD